MNLKTKEIYSGFQLIESKYIKEVDSTGYLFEHEKTGAKLYYLSNKDDNKVFSVSFRTPPTDSTGLPHILEHSVLCGSEKYPVKEPFVELIKGSLNTFLNAMTFPDKTMYPIASMNNKDFINLMDVYLDAVFNPNIYAEKGIFLQEGWHYHLENAEDDIRYVGVVYNEMKGAFSNPEEVVNRKVQETLFPDTPYGLESGGDPDVIIDLTYEDFIDFHRKYYHPSNSYIYFYGDGDILEHLAFVHENYLSKYDKLQIDSSISMQEPFNEPKEKVYSYPISSTESTKEKTFLTMNWVTGVSTDPQTHLGLEMLAHILLNSPSAPLKKALLQAELGKDVMGSFDGGILQPVISVMIKNSEEDRKEEFKKIINKTLKSLVDNGIDRDQIKAAINISEFKMKEADFGSYPKGLIYGINIMDSWLYDGDPSIYLEYEDDFEFIRENIDQNYFEKLIEKYLLNNNHCSLLVAKPQQGLVDKDDLEIEKRLKEYKEQLSQEELEFLIKETKDLIARQNTSDDPKDIEKIPVLPIEDIKKDIEELPLEIKKFENVEFLHTPVNTNGIVYTSLLFDIKNVSKEYIPYVALLARYLGEVSTQEYSFEQLTNEIEIYTGGIDFDIDVYANSKNIEEYEPKFIIKGRALKENLDKLFHIISQMIVHSKYDEKQRLKEIIQSSKARTEMLFMSAGHKIVANRVNSYYAKSAKFLESIDGIDYYEFIKTLEEDFNNKENQIFEKLKKTSELLFNKNSLIFSLTCDEKDYHEVTSSFESLYNQLKDEKLKRNEYDFEMGKFNEGLMTSSKVQYVGKAYNVLDLGYEYTGALQVVKSIMSTEYLWNKIRVQGGAYGAFFSIGRSGTLFVGSYRDPNLRETVNTINSMPEFIESFESSQREMNKYIIGTISNLDTPMTPAMKGNTATGNYLRNVTQEDLQRERDQVLSCTTKDIQNTAKIVKEAMSKNYLCVLGNDRKIEEAKELFESTVNLFK